MKKEKKKSLLAAVAVGWLLCLGTALWLSGPLRDRGELLRELDRNTGSYDPQSIVLRDTTPGEASRLAERFGAQLRTTGDGSYARLILPEGMNIRAAVAASLLDAGKLAADYRVQASAVSQAAAEDPDSALQTYLEALNLADVWSSTKGGKALVAVIDTGIDTDHPEFVGRISRLSYNATEDKVVADHGWEVIEDTQGHGTAVSGVLAAAMDGLGTVGIAPEAELLIIKAACDSMGNFLRTSDLVFGLYYAIEQNARVVNMSFAGPEAENPYGEATRLAWERDILCVAAAGNNGTGACSWPAADEYVVGVAALDESGALAGYSNYGQNGDLTAPGTVYTTGLDGSYKTISGTSFSCPMVSAAAALLVSLEPEISAGDFRELLFACCRDLGEPGRDGEYGFGLPDVSALVQGQRFTVTFDMLTDGMAAVSGTFLSGISLQDLPRPEREDAVLEGWYYDREFTRKYRYSEDLLYEDTTLYARWVSEEEGIPYTYAVLEDGTVELRSYTGSKAEIEIPPEIGGKTVSAIGAYAFAGCTGLTEVRIPETVTVLGEGAFQNAENLSVLIFAPGSRLEKLEGYVFAGCTSLRRVELPANLRKLSGTDFLGAAALEEITVEAGSGKFTHRDGVLFNAAGDILLVYPAAGGSHYALPEGTVRIGDYAFAYARLESVDLTGLQKLNQGAFRYSSLKSVTLPDTVNRVEESVFADCTDLKTVTLGSGITVLSEGMFRGCEGLASVTVPAKIRKINADAFREAGLKELRFEEGSRLEIIGEEAFRGCALRELNLPESVKEIGTEAFAGNGALDGVSLPGALETLGAGAFRDCGLTELEIPALLTDIGEGAFARCESLEELRVAEDNAAYRSEDGVLLTKDGKALHTFPAGKAAESYEIPGSVETVMEYAFAGTGRLEKLVLPEGLTVLGRNSLRQGGFAELSLPHSLEEIGDYALAETDRLEALRIPDGVARIGRCAFAGSAVTQVTFGPGTGLRRVGTYAFAGCEYLTELSLPETLEHIGYGAVPERKAVPGDANGDERADYADALLILRHSIGLEEMRVALVKQCDLNGDGRADYADALTVLRRSIGLE